MNRTAIVIGATGLVGRSVVEQLAKAPHIDRVVTLTRRAVQPLPPRVTNHVVDFERLDEHAALFTGDYFFSCLGTTRKQAGSIEAQRKVDLDYQLAAARLAARVGVAHYLLVSSTSANAASSNPYLKMKGELEQQVLQLPFKRISIFQPSVLIGEREHPRPGEKIGGVMLQALRLIPGVRRYRPIRGDEVAAKMVEVSSAPGPSPEWFRLDEVFPSRPVSVNP